jgi:hypothetical protein
MATTQCQIRVGKITSLSGYFTDIGGSGYSDRVLQCETSWRRKSHQMIKMKRKRYSAEFKSKYSSL